MVKQMEGQKPNSTALISFREADEKLKNNKNKLTFFGGRQGQMRSNFSIKPNSAVFWLMTSSHTWFIMLSSSIPC